MQKERKRMNKKIDMSDPNHCNECGKTLDNKAFFCSDECVREMIKHWRYEQYGH